jgi:hypothetical protein
MYVLFAVYIYTGAAQLFSFLSCRPNSLKKESKGGERKYAEGWEIHLSNNMVLKRSAS